MLRVLRSRSYYVDQVFDVKKKMHVWICFLPIEYAIFYILACSALRVCSITFPWVSEEYPLTVCLYD